MVAERAGQGAGFLWALGGGGAGGGICLPPFGYAEISILHINLFKRL